MCLIHVKLNSKFQFIFENRNLTFHFTAYINVSNFKRKRLHDIIVSAIIVSETIETFQNI